MQKLNLEHFLLASNQDFEFFKTFVDCKTINPNISQVILNTFKKTFMVPEPRSISIF